MNVEITKRARKQIDGLDKSTQKKIDSAIKGLEFFEGDIVKMAGRNNEYRLKVFHYRIIFRIEDGNRAIITEVGKRGDIY